MWDVPRDIDLNEHWRSLSEQRARDNVRLSLKLRRKLIMEDKKLAPNFEEEDEFGNKYAKIVSSENGAEIGRTYENGNVFYHKDFVDALREEILELKKDADELDELLLRDPENEDTRGDVSP